MKLNLGSGRASLPGYVNVDVLAYRGVNVICDLNQPFPFEDASFEAIRCYDILEHLIDLLAIMREIARVLKPGGLLQIRGPVWGSKNHRLDPTHFRAFEEHSFDYFDPGTPLGAHYQYEPCCFKIVEVKVEGDNLLFTLRKRI